MNGRVLIIAGFEFGGGAGILAAIEHPPVITKPAAPIPRLARQIADACYHHSGACPRATRSAPRHRRSPCRRPAHERLPLAGLFCRKRRLRLAEAAAYHRGLARIIAPIARP